jgi:hypothetical protein
MATSSGPGRRLYRGLWRGVWPNAHARASRAPTRPLGRQLNQTTVEHRSLAPSPPWAGRDGEGRSGSQGWRRASEWVSQAPLVDGSPFWADHPRLGCCKDVTYSLTQIHPGETWPAYVLRGNGDGHSNKCPHHREYCQSVAIQTQPLVLCSVLWKLKDNLSRGGKTIFNREPPWGRSR